MFKLAYIRDTSPFIELSHAGALGHLICQVFLVVFLNILVVSPKMQNAMLPTFRLAVELVLQMRLVLSSSSADPQQTASLDIETVTHTVQ
jgi:hypothetical protein